MSEPDFQYPEDTLVGASERLRYYARESGKVLVAHQPFKAVLAFDYWLLDRLARLLNKVTPHG